MALHWHIQFHHRFISTANSTLLAIPVAVAAPPATALPGSSTTTTGPPPLTSLTIHFPSQVNNNSANWLTSGPAAHIAILFSYYYQLFIYIPITGTIHFCYLQLFPAPIYFFLPQQQQVNKTTTTIRKHQPPPFRFRSRLSPGPAFIASRSTAASRAPAGSALAALAGAGSCNQQTLRHYCCYFILFINGNATAPLSGAFTSSSRHHY